MGFWNTRSNKFAILVTFIFALVGCGGGSSNSGGQAAVTLVIVQPGFYRGTRTFVFTLDDVSSDPETSDITLTVTGQPPGQQVRIAFQQFSGSSSIGPNQEFSIPSGTFRLGPCQASIVFTGRFVGNGVTGDETGTVNCPDIQGAISLSATFEATFSLSKQSFSEPDYPVVLKSADWYFSQ